MGRDLEMPWSELLSTGGRFGRLRGTGVLCSGSLCSTTAWLKMVEVDYQTLAWVTGQLDPVGAVSKSLDFMVWSCPRVIQFLSVVSGQDGGVQPTW